MTTLLLAMLLAVQEEKPTCKDKTGIAWVHPFTEARKKAKETGRLLMIKPIPLGPQGAEGGDRPRKF